MKNRGEHLEKLQSLLDTAVSGGDVPFVVAMCAGQADVRWAGVAGEASESYLAATDTVFRVFSMTKAVGATAAMILIDRGLAAMDDPVEAYLPEATDLQVLAGWTGDQAIFRSPKVKPTLRHLATHTSGLAYDTWDADMDRWTRQSGQIRATTGQLAGLHAPLMFQPGSAWTYGIGLDWLGRVVEAIDGRRIDQFLTDEIFEPLGMTDTSCEVQPHMTDRLAGVWKRSNDGAFVATNRAPPSQPEFYGMGHALYSTPQDYLKFLRMVLGQGVLGGTRILSEAAVQSLLANSIGDLSIPQVVSQNANVSADLDLFPGTRLTHSFAAIRTEANVPGKRSAGSQGWAGVLNTHWWIDPAKDIAAVLMTQTLPFAEPRFMAFYDRFERAVYEAQVRPQA